MSLKRARICFEAVHPFGYFEVADCSLSHDKYDGRQSPVHSRQIVRKEDFSAVLLIDQPRRCLWLVEQFRPASYLKEPSEGWLLELPAGGIDPGESPQAAAIRETVEETGFKIHDLADWGRFYVSPGYTDERCHLFCAQVGGQDVPAHGEGTDLDEDLKLVPLAFDEVSAALTDGRIRDAKTLYALARWFGATGAASA